MERFKQFELENPEFIFGGEFFPTFIGEGGDFYDSERGVFVIILK